MKHGHEHTEYAGFANLPEKEIYTKLRKLNKSRNKTYWLGEKYQRLFYLLGK